MADPPDLSGFLLGDVLPSLPALPALPNATDVLTGLTGLSSIAGGFDHAYVGGHEDENDFFANLSLGGSGGGMDHLMAKTYDKLKCGHFTAVDKRLHFTVDVASDCRFWSEGVLSSVVAAFGLLGNIVSIWVLSVPEMRNSFNRLLMALAIIDCLFIMPGILIYTSKAFGWKADWYNYAFPVFLYPFSEIALCSSIYMTVAIAVERYIGLCRPLKRLSGRGPCSAKAYIVPVVVIALLLNVPKFLESETLLLRPNPLTNSTRTKVKVSDLRTHPHYITYYWMWTRLLATGVIPLIVLALLNSKIYLSIRHSKQQLRVLAIRSALPMAILGQSAPSVPALPKSPTNGSAARNCHHHHHPIPVRTGRPGEDDDIRNAPDSPIANGQTVLPAAHAAVLPSSPCGRIVNGQFRHIQRSVSAFEPSCSSRQLSKAQLQQQAKMLRSNSSTASTATTVVMNNNWNPPGADMKLAPILFGVVIVFVVCNCLRVALNIYDFTVVDGIIKCEKVGVGRLPPAWVLCSISVSHLLLMVNSSVNFLVYCVAGTRFRRILMRKLRGLVKGIIDVACCRKRADEFHYGNNKGRNNYHLHQVDHERRRNTVLTMNLLARAPEVLREEEEIEEPEEPEPSPETGERSPDFKKRNGETEF